MMIRFALSLTLVFLASAVWAEPESQVQTEPHSLRVEVDADSEEGRGVHLMGTYFFKNGVHFILGGGSSHIKGDTENKTNSEFNFEMASDPSRRFGGGLAYDFWGLQDSLTVETLKVPLRIKLSQWRIAVTPGFGEVTLTGPRSGRESTVEDKSWALSVGYAGIKNWRLSVQHEVHDYDKDLVAIFQTQILGQPVFSFLPSNTASLLGNLVQHRTAISAVSSFADFDLGLQISLSQSAVDDSKSRTSTVFCDYFVNDNWALLGSIGRSVPEDEVDAITGEKVEPVGFLTLGFEYAFSP